MEEQEEKDPEKLPCPHCAAPAPHAAAIRQEQRGGFNLVEVAFRCWECDGEWGFEVIPTMEADHA